MTDPVDKRTAPNLIREDLLEVHVLGHQRTAVEARIEALLYKSGLGQERDRVVEILAALSQRLTAEYDAEGGHIDAATGTVTRKPAALKSV